MTIKTIVFITGTRADYGKIKSLIAVTKNHFVSHIYVCGMHLMESHGMTVKDIISDGQRNVYCASEQRYSGKMDLDLANALIQLHEYLDKVKPDLIVVHGDRIEALAGSIAGMLNNIHIAHIEGGEVTGTVDEAIRHSVSKMANYHFVANFESKLRLRQLGEPDKHIFVIGSPDIDIMVSQLPEVSLVKKKHDIPFDDFSIIIFHPVTTELSLNQRVIQNLLLATDSSCMNYVVIFPNNDHGSDVIISEIMARSHNSRYKVFKSLPFEDFSSLLKKANFIIGNSSAGIREACIFGIPCIDIGSRQQGRYRHNILRNIQHCETSVDEIISCIGRVDNHRIRSSFFGKGDSANRFIDALMSISTETTQKRFIDSTETQLAIANYINEVCF